MSKLVHITSPQHFSQILQSSRIVVTDFWAEWCGPCRQIAPLYERASEQLSRPNIITFTKVDTESQKDIARTYNISAIPTFLIFKAGREIQRIQGANVAALNEALKKLAQEAANAGDGASEGSSGSSGAWGLKAPTGYSEVTDSVDSRGLDFLNLDSQAGDSRVVFDSSPPSSLGGKGKAAEGTKDWIESDTDEQLMLFVPFQSTLKLHSLHITSIRPSDDDEAPMRPRKIQLYTNHSHVLGFDEAEDTPAVQEFEIAADQWDSKTGTANIPLRFVKFQNVSSLVIFVVNGDGDGEKTRIDRIRIFGETGEKRSMGKLEKVGEDH